MSHPQVSRVSGEVFECEDLKYCKSCCMYHIEGMHIPTPAEPERLLATVTPDPSAAVVAEAPAPATATATATASAPPERRGQSIHFDVTIRPASCRV
ncbi:hypothetical protein R5R35_013226 [Gryllus longicercus]|uniref:Uncharacterized protein n=1 Tax=Gryllus longicercus TaxID=2509291 RepID=A0AAN9WCA1_9ORTH